eukprot:154652_1
MHVDLFGYNAGFGANISCDYGDLCHINCYGNGCYMTYIDCKDKANGSNCIINTESNSVYPITDINQFSTTVTTANILLYDSKSFTIANDQACNEPNNNNNTYDEYRQHQGGDIVVNVDTQMQVCCRGSDSCTYVDKIRVSSTTQHSIICSGSQACEIADTIITNNNSPVFCEGEMSCQGIDIITTNDVYCLSEYACENTDIFKAKNVFCAGKYSCDGKVVSNGTDVTVYLLGYGSYVKLYCGDADNCTVVCGAKSTCENLYFYGNVSIQYNFGYGYPTLEPTFEPTLEPTYLILDFKTKSSSSSKPHCLQDDVAFLNTTYKLSSGKETCIDDILQFIYDLIEIIDATYLQSNLLVNSNITDQERKQFLHINDHQFCGNITFYIFTCFNEQIEADWLVNVVKSTEFIHDIEDEININRNNTIIYITILNTTIVHIIDIVINAEQ